jgi:hypothetical protein
MRDLVLPLAVMATTIIVALGLITFFRHLIKLRSELAPEVVFANPTAKVASNNEMPEFVRTTRTINRHDAAA